MRISDWSSDVCSSDLAAHRAHRRDHDQMAVVLGAEDLHCRFALRERCDEVGFGSLAVGVEIAGAKWLALAEPGVDDDAIDTAEVVAKGAKDFEHMLEVKHVRSDKRRVGKGGVSTCKT